MEALVSFVGNGRICVPQRRMTDERQGKQGNKRRIGKGIVKKREEWMREMVR